MNRNFSAADRMRHAEMVPSSDAQAPLTKNRTSIAVLLLPAFNALATMAFLDPFRAANYLTGSTLYDWDMVSLAGGALAASNGLQVGGTHTLKQARGALRLRHRQRELGA